MNCLMLYPRASTNLHNNAFDWLRQEALNCGIQLSIDFFENYPNFICSMPNCLIMRGYNQNISTHFEQKDIWVLNRSDAMQAALNKVVTHNILVQNNIPTPQIIYNHNADYDFKRICDAFNDNRFVVKKIDGSKGENVFLVTSENELRSAIRKCSQNCLCQQFIATSFGQDIRAWVIGDEVVGAVLRYNQNSFLSNFSQGGSARLIEIPTPAAEMAIQSSKALGLEFSGVDILLGPNDCYTVCEVNGNAGFRTISQFSDNPDNNIPRKLFHYISVQAELKSRSY